MQNTRTASGHAMAMLTFPDLIPVHNVTSELKRNVRNVALLKTVDRSVDLLVLERPCLGRDC